MIARYFQSPFTPFNNDWNHRKRRKKNLPLNKSIKGSTRVFRPLGEPSEGMNTKFSKCEQKAATFPSKPSCFTFHLLTPVFLRCRNWRSLIPELMKMCWVMAVTLGQMEDGGGKWECCCLNIVIRKARKCLWFITSPICSSYIRLFCQFHRNVSVLSGSSNFEMV